MAAVWISLSRDMTSSYVTNRKRYIFWTFYISSRFHCHCFNMLEVPKGAEFAPLPGLNRVKLLRAHKSTYKMLIGFSILYFGKMYTQELPHICLRNCLPVLPPGQVHEEKVAFGANLCPIEKTIIQKLN